MNDELEEDEDLHNKLKNYHKISDEQIIANNAKISPESARVAQLTQEIDMLEEDSAESKSNKSKLFDTKQQQRTLSRQRTLRVGRTLSWFFRSITRTR